MDEKTRLLLLDIASYLRAVNRGHKAQPAEAHELIDRIEQRIEEAATESREPGHAKTDWNPHAERDR